MAANVTRWDWIWLAVCGVLSSLWCLTAASQLSATFDEPTYVKEGLEHWRSGSYHRLMRLGTMPLPVDVQTLPLYCWELWRGKPFNPRTQFDQLLPVARAMNLVFWWLLLLYGMLAGRFLAGPWGGRLAVALLAFEPSLVAHAALATTDISVTACLLAFVYHFRVNREAGLWRRRAAPALWLALAILAKASGLIFGGLCMVFLEAERLLRAGAFATTEAGVRARLRQAWQAWQPFLRDACWIVGGGLAGMLLYVGSEWQAEPSFIRWARTLPEGAFASAMLWLSENLCIFPNGFEGLVQQCKHNVRGHGTYILGQSFERAVWYYFPVLLTIKLTLTLLLALAWLGLTRPRALSNWALITALGLVLVSPAFRVQIGLRLILPLVVLGIVGLAAALVCACRELVPGWRKRLTAGLAAAGVLWSATALAFAWPHGLTYVNELHGGSAQGYRVVSEANYDWGQGLPDLVRWQAEHGETLAVWYYGTDPRLKRWPLCELAVHNLPIACEEDACRLLAGRLLAVSTTLLHYTHPNGANPAHRHAIRYLRGRQPAARTQTFMIYDLR